MARNYQDYKEQARVEDYLRGLDYRVVINPAEHDPESEDEHYVHVQFLTEINVFRKYPATAWLSRLRRLPAGLKLRWGAENTSFEALKEVGFTVHQVVQGLATQGSVRRIDIIAIKNNSAYILDPTIRFETHADQPHEVDSEKKRIYEPTIPFYKDKYSLSHIDVIGLMVGARVLAGRVKTVRPFLPRTDDADDDDILDAPIQQECDIQRSKRQARATDFGCYTVSKQ
ncbi:hypothetical protein ANN_22428 [Periplaneta americana]|uniref:Uncharacterized protein n=1 Tax=Periplaneta americana TaxID=6978 RepID=A0ABQ8S8F0_PERAM|nr:hypothetical protein ANN_22428 [Periplaneta americana]